MFIIFKFSEKIVPLLYYDLGRILYQKENKLGSVQTSRTSALGGTKKYLGTSASQFIYRAKKISNK